MLAALSRLTNRLGSTTSPQEQQQQQQQQQQATTSSNTNALTTVPSQPPGFRAPQAGRTRRSRTGSRRRRRQAVSESHAIHVADSDSTSAYDTDAEVEELEDVLRSRRQRYRDALVVASPDPASGSLLDQLGPLASLPGTSSPIIIMSPTAASPRGKVDAARPPKPATTSSTSTTTTLPPHPGSPLLSLPTLRVRGARQVRAARRRRRQQRQRRQRQGQASTTSATPYSATARRGAIIGHVSSDYDADWDTDQEYDDSSASESEAGAGAGAGSGWQQPKYSRRGRRQRTTGADGTISLTTVVPLAAATKRGDGWSSHASDISCTTASVSVVTYNTDEMATAAAEGGNGDSLSRRSSDQMVAAEAAHPQHTVEAAVDAAVQDLKRGHQQQPSQQQRRQAQAELRQYQQQQHSKATSQQEQQRQATEEGDMPLQSIAQASAAAAQGVLNKLKHNHGSGNGASSSSSSPSSSSATTLSRKQATPTTGGVTASMPPLLKRSVGYTMKAPTRLEVPGAIFVDDADYTDSDDERVRNATDRYSNMALQGSSSARSINTPRHQRATARHLAPVEHSSSFTVGIAMQPRRPASPPARRSSPRLDALKFSPVRPSTLARTRSANSASEAEPQSAQHLPTPPSSGQQLSPLTRRRRRRRRQAVAVARPGGSAMDLLAVGAASPTAAASRSPLARAAAPVSDSDSGSSSGSDVLPTPPPALAT